MDDPFFMGRIQRISDLSRDGQGIIQLQWAAAKAIRQCVTVHEFHDDDRHAGLALPRLQPINLRNVRMIQRREKARLSFESRQPLGVDGERRRQNLDRDLAAQPRIARSIHLAHPAGADGGEDLYGPSRAPALRAKRFAVIIKVRMPA